MHNLTEEQDGEELDFRNKFISIENPQLAQRNDVNFVGYNFTRRHLRIVIAILL